MLPRPPRAVQPRLACARSVRHARAAHRRSSEAPRVKSRVPPSSPDLRDLGASFAPRRRLVLPAAHRRAERGSPPPLGHHRSCRRQRARTPPPLTNMHPQLLHRECAARPPPTGAHERHCQPPRRRVARVLTQRRQRATTVSHRHDRGVMLRGEAQLPIGCARGGELEAKPRHCMHQTWTRGGGAAHRRRHRTQPPPARAQAKPLPRRSRACVQARRLLLPLVPAAQRVQLTRAPASVEQRRRRLLERGLERGLERVALERSTVAAAAAAAAAVVLPRRRLGPFVRGGRTWPPKRSGGQPRLRRQWTHSRQRRRVR